MLFQKDFIYNDEALNAALEIMEKTVFKKKKIAGMTAFCMFPVMFFIIGLILSDTDRTEWIISVIVSAVFFPLIAFFLMGSFRKEYISANSLSEGEKYFSPERTLTIYDDYINIYAKYSNSDVILTDEDRADEDFMEYFNESNEEMSNIKYPLSKCRCYENDKAFIIYISRDLNQPVLKSQLEQSDIEFIHNTLKEKLGKKYIEL
ncbi:MAG: hypothetical protein ACI4JM_05800 [Oscillospiraceae bacterium]